MDGKNRKFDRQQTKDDKIEREEERDLFDRLLLEKCILKCMKTDFCWKSLS